ncbi:integrase [Staphylococcus aureus]|nr:integrase [Staphylococcus aureus]
MKTRCYDGKKWQYEFKYEGKRYRKKGFRTKREANSAGLDVNVNIKMYINDCIRMYKIVC